MDLEKIIKELNEKQQKEIEELKNDYNNLSDSLVVKEHCIKNSIPVEAIKDKIENGVSFEKYKDYYQKSFVDYNNGYLKALYELLEERS